jgi:uncharacterized protein
MRCPQCRKETSKQDNPFFPFCSERCKLVDLDKWLSGDYLIPGRDGEFQPPEKPNSDSEDKE